MESRVQLLAWLSISRMIRSSLELLVCFFTYSRTFKNRGSMIQELWGLFTSPKLPGGAPNISESWSLALREMKTGGTVLPTELMIIHTVIIVLVHQRQLVQPVLCQSDQQTSSFRWNLIRPRPLPSTAFSFCCSLNIVPFSTTSFSCYQHH